MSNAVEFAPPPWDGVPGDAKSLHAIASALSAMHEKLHELHKVMSAHRHEVDSYWKSQSANAAKRSFDANLTDTRTLQHTAGHGASAVRRYATELEAQRSEYNTLFLHDEDLGNEIIAHMNATGAQQPLHSDADLVHRHRQNLQRLAGMSDQAAQTRKHVASTVHGIEPAALHHHGNGTGGASAHPHRRLTLRQHAARDLATSVVPVVVPENRRTESTGTGWLLDAKGDIVTAAHVIPRGAKRVYIVDSAGRLVRCHVMGIDRKNDVAVIRCTALAGGTPLALASREPSRPQDVAALSHDDGDPAHGSVVRDTTRIESVTVTGAGEPDQQARLLRLDGGPGAQPGDSGGPVIDSSGRVIGIVDAGAQGITAVVPITRVRGELLQWAAG
jgi:S1-C subfamily serine protease